MTIRDDFCPVTGNRIIEWGFKGLVPKKRPNKSHRQFEVLMSNGTRWVVAVHQEGFDLLKENPALLDELWGATQQYWKSRGVISYPGLKIHNPLWDTVKLGLSER